MPSPFAVVERADVHLVDDGVLVPVGLASAGVDGRARRRGAGARGASQEVVEVVLGAHLAPHAEDVRRHHGRVELDVVARAVPDVARAAEQVVHLERRVAARGRARRAARSSHAGLRVVRVEVDDADDDVVAALVASCCRRAAASLSIGVEARRRSCAAAPGCRGGRRSRCAIRRRRLSGSSRSQWRSWYFSESRYSSLPGCSGAVLAELEGRAVDAVVRRRASRRARGARRTSARPPFCRCSVQDVRRVRPEVRAEELAHRSACVSSVKYSRSSCCGVAPGEVRVRLA